MRFTAVIISYFALADAFGFLGHRLASTCIWKQLSPEAKARIALIVTKNEFLTLGGWPDRIKHSDGWKWTQKLHYLDTDDDPPNLCKIPEPEEMCRMKPNVISATINYTERFRNGSRTKEDLGFMMHFLMDLHQPLHLVQKARGGNDYKVWYRGKRVNVHLLWDSKMVKRLILAKGYRELSDEIINMNLTLSGSIWEWAREANRLNCDIVFNTDGHVDPDIWEAALLEIIHKGTKRVASLIEEIIAES